MGDSKHAQLSIRPTCKVGEEAKRKPQDLHCLGCRHANQKQSDFEDGFIYCKISGRHVGTQGFCRETIDIDETNYYYFEAYDGTNSTWNWNGDIVI